MKLTEKQKVKLKERLFILSAIIIQLSVFIIFYIYCNFQSVAMAFQWNDNVKGETIWTFRNFIDIWQDITAGYKGELLIALVNTFKFFILGQILFPIAFMTSYFMYKKVPGHRAYRILFFIPSVVSAVVWSNIFKEIMGAQGPLSQLFVKLHWSENTFDFLTTDKYALGAVMLYSIWFGVASNFVLYSGTLTRIPNELIEVGALEGISWGRELIQIIVPLVWPTLSTVWLMSLMGIFSSSGNILLLTNGENGTMTLSHYLFLQVYNAPEGVGSNTFNYSSAMGLLLTVLTLPVVFLVQFLLGKVENVEY